MKTCRASAAGLAATAVVISAAIAACGGDKESAPDSSASSSAAASASASESSSADPAGASDYSNLLIKPSDIGPNATADGPPIPNPGGVTGVGQTFRNTDGMRIIVDTIAVFPDAAAAAAAVPAMKDAVAKKVTGEQQPADVGTDGFMVAGTSADPAKQMEISEIVFVQGRALVDLEFDSSPGNPTPNDVLLELARKQDAAVKEGLPS